MLRKLTDSDNFDSMESRDVVWIGTSLDDLRAFPAARRRVIGGELWRVQNGVDPHNFKTMPTVGSGAFEIRVKDATLGRLIYVARYPEAIYVLHVFEKKTERTPQKDINLAKKRYDEMLNRRN